MLYAISCVCNEEYYLHTFLDHLRSYVDGFIFLDGGSTDRTLFILENDPKVVKIIKKPVKDNPLNYDEAGNRELILRETYKLTSDKNNTWVLCCDPDERFELRFLQQLKQLTSEYANKCYGLHFREIYYNKKYYRCDGIWDQKEKFILFPLSATMTFETTHRQRTHVPWHYDNLQSQLELTDYNIYHLRMLKELDRHKRAQLYNAIDPNKELQKIGYDYLVDSSGIRIKKIPYFKRYDYSFLPADIQYYDELNSVSCDNDKVVLFTLLYADGYHGSVIHVYELGSYFVKQGFSVLCATLSYTSEIKELYSSAGIELVTVYDVPKGKHFDIIYGLHYPLYGYLFSKSVSCEKLIMSSLSGFLTIESYPLYWKDASLLLVHTKENKQQQIERLNIPEDKIYVLENLIPEKFSKYEYKREKRDIPSSPLNIIVVSNHAPREIIDLQKFEDISVTFFGLGCSNYQLITPEVLSKYDVVIAIGKTVQYSLGMGIPVYEYDHFGGIGYITAENFEDTRKFNFSGRSSCRKISSEEIHNELIQGYDNSYNESSQLKTLALECFDEATNLNRLLSIIDCSPSFNAVSSQSSPNLQMYFLNNKDFCDYVFNLRNTNAVLQNTNTELQNALIAEHENTERITQSFNEISNAFFWKITKPIRSLLDYFKKPMRNS